MKRLWCLLTGHQGLSVFRDPHLVSYNLLDGIVRCARCQKVVNW